MTLPPLLRSASFRLTLIYILLFGSSAALLLGFLYWATAGTLSDQVDAIIEADIKGLAEQYEQRGTPGVAAIISERVRKDPGGRTVYLLTDPLRRPLVGNLSKWPTVAPDASGWIEFELQDRDAPDGEVYLARARPFVLLGGLNLLVGREVRELVRTRDMAINAVIWGSAITLALALAGGIAMSRSTTRRIEAINQTSREIADGALDRRIPTLGTDDEFDRLAIQLNEMLDRNQSLMEGLRHVTDNIAHDLRTPLSRLRQTLESLDENGLSKTGRTTRIDRAIAEADGLLSVFNALLRITQIEAGGRRENFATIDIGELLRDVAELYEPVAEEKNLSFSLRCDETTGIEGDRDLLFQAIGNLADNAVKYAPPGGSVTMHAADRTVTVSDTGPGIPEEAFGEVFLRFHRLETARSTPGSGLGLSLVEAVANLHNGEVKLEDNCPGLKAILTVG
ncbi:MAG: HAMP domain-containing histidine kinase [Rhodospirillaceae bacterium]|nr:two-component sensor histidine kinase [Rhodospirillaceae bacterium]RPG02572.1 MAG: sensor histidine kinase [Rhodospirillaceae bacterium TMED63]RZO37020.1 MAG: HAMP domain-containing histidine kinase [Rhodospirillaceae bacterium]